MNQETRQLSRWAGRIHAGLRRLGEARWSEVHDQVRQLGSRLENLSRLRGHLNSCQDRGWSAAASSVLQDISYELTDLRRQINDCEQAIEATKSPTIRLRAVYEEFRQLRGEFEEVRMDDQARALVVTTDSIELEEVALGRFEIRLELERIVGADAGHLLRIVALEPNPSQSDEGVTHPHVREEQLCAGEAGAAMQEAIRSGRICDLFLMARAVLQTYNPDSPYVKLENWEGRPCHDCGYVMDGEDSSWCERCNHDFCEECFSCCRGCDTSLCRGCLTSCELCDDLYCAHCLQGCRECGERACGSCLEEGLCGNCREQQEEMKTNEQGTHSDGWRFYGAAGEEADDQVAGGVAGEADHQELSPNDNAGGEVDGTSADCQTVVTAA